MLYCSELSLHIVQLDKMDEEWCGYFHCDTKEAGGLLVYHTACINFRGILHVSHLDVLKRTWCMIFAGRW